MVKVPEIEHLFSPPAQRPSDSIASVFSLFILATFVWFLLKLSSLNLNTALYNKINQLASFLFFLSLFSILGLLIWFWVQGNIIDTVKVLIPLSILFLLTAKYFFQAHSKAKTS